MRINCSALGHYNNSPVKIVSEGVYVSMAKIKERVAYLQGLTQGLNVSSSSAEGKVLVSIIDVLDEMAEEFTNMQMAQEDLGTFVESIDEDLTDLEEEVYEDVEDENFVEVECPSCRETVSFASDILEDDDDVEVSCPHCGEIVFDSCLDITDMDMNDQHIDYNLRDGIHPGI